MQPLARACSSLMVVALLVPVAVEAQSLLGSGGLGVPLDPLGARTRALGNPGIGLFGAAIHPTDPTGALDVPLPTVTGSFQPTTGTLEGLGPDADLSTVRFPLFAVAYPAGEGNTLLLTLGSFLDQNWALDVESEVDLAGEQVPVTDRFTSDGGVSTVSLGFGRVLASNLAVAVAGGVHVGELTRSFSREFDEEGTGADVEPFTVEGRWRMSAPTISLGVRYDPLSAVRVSASLTWSGDLEARPQDDTEGGDRDFPLPLQYRLGASAELTPVLGATLGVAWADWTDTGGALDTGSAVGRALTVGGGLEWTGFRMLNRSFPVRLGARHSDLPFRFGGEDPSELVFAGGLGANLVESDDGVPLAAVDLAVELGSREAEAVKESFTRITVTFRVAGN